MSSNPIPSIEPSARSPKYDDKNIKYDSNYSECYFNYNRHVNNLEPKSKMNQDIYNRKKTARALEEKSSNSSRFYIQNRSF